MTFQNPFTIHTYAVRIKHSKVDLTFDLTYTVQMNIKVKKKQATQDGKKLALPLPGDKSITY